MFLCVACTNRTGVNLFGLVILKKTGAITSTYDPHLTMSRPCSYQSGFNIQKNLHLGFGLFAKTPRARTTMPLFPGETNSCAFHFSDNGFGVEGFGMISQSDRIADVE